ncbi:hypothetical protein K492DRAFT_198287 [Lichtheimia hyalospora FSU 10163]|nr:hypothetical protein K492DRAFT_198287 [Lichtheimia hyalospora FSU 10163]
MIPYLTHLKQDVLLNELYENACKEFCKKMDPLPLPEFDDPQEAPEITKWLFPENKSDTWQVTQEVYDRLVALEEACNHKPEYKPKEFPLFHLNVPAKCYRKGNTMESSCQEDQAPKMQVIRLDRHYSPPSSDDDKVHATKSNDQKGEGSTFTVMGDQSASVIHKDQLMDLDMLISTLSQHEDMQGDTTLNDISSLNRNQEPNNDPTPATFISLLSPETQRNTTYPDTLTAECKQQHQMQQSESTLSISDTSDQSVPFMHVDALSGVNRATAIATAPNPERIYKGLPARDARPPNTLNPSSRFQFSATRNINDFISSRRPSTILQQKGLVLLFVNMDHILIGFI